MGDRKEEEMTLSWPKDSRSDRGEIVYGFVEDDGSVLLAAAHLSLPYRSDSSFMAEFLGRNYGTDEAAKNLVISWKAYLLNTQDTCVASVEEARACAAGRPLLLYRGEGKWEIENIEVSK